MSGKKLIIFLIKQPLWIRRTFLIILDLINLFISIKFSFWILFNDINSLNYYWIQIFAAIFLIPIYVFTGQYKGIFRFENRNNFYKISARNFLLFASLYILGKIFNLSFTKINIFLLMWLFANVLMGISRSLIRDSLNNLNKSSTSKKIPVAIYGAGKAGSLLANSLKIEGKYKIICFIDDDEILWGRYLDGIPIKSKTILDEIKNEIKNILLAIPSISYKKKKKLISSIEDYGVSILQIPSIKSLSEGKAKINNLSPIAIEDLLSRDRVLPDINTINSGINGKVVCITGAGGSIGQELCKQIISYFPRKIILLEHHEPSLYEIETKLISLNNRNIKIKGILGSATNARLVDNIFKNEQVELVFHSAAYKHVPIVELNPISGLYNNLISTLVICESAIKNKIKKLILISSDKAVRPTNVMGASKRISELIVQASQQQFNEESSSYKGNNYESIFAMVRFGNVLGSSGSVVPLFQKQIASGGPITLTDKRITRYFMTIKEASELVLQASTIAKGGEVFLLDMGAPVYVKDLAIKMVKLSGLTIKDESNLDGDIEIEITGLRPGEKLCEELLINNQAESTEYDLIFKSNESFISYQELWPKLESLKVALENYDLENSIKIVKELVPEWKAQL
tara:strand:+ start:208 stop:2097 length:1890 start_codon:yes stop_codon:yes gene_type:complete